MEYILIKFTIGKEKHKFQNNGEFINFLSGLRTYPVFYHVVGYNHSNEIIKYIKSIKSECKLLIEFDKIVYLVGDVLTNGDNPLETTLYGSDAIQFVLKDFKYMKIDFNLFKNYFDKIIKFNQTAVFKCNDNQKVEKLVNENNL